MSLTFTATVGQFCRILANAYNYNGNYTAMVAFKPSAIGVKQTLLAASSALSSSDTEQLYISAAGKLCIECHSAADGDAADAVGTTTLVAGTEYYFTIRRTGNVIDALINGVIDASVTKAVPGRTAADRFYFGRYTGGGTEANGLVTSCKVWTIAKNDATVALESTQLDPVSLTSLTLWWRMETAGVTTDSSGNGKTMVIGGTLAQGAAFLIPWVFPTAILTGTAIGGITEADIVAGGKTIIITLTNGTFIP